MFCVWGQADSMFGVKIALKLARQSPLECLIVIEGRKVRAAQSKMTANGRTQQGFSNKAPRRGIGPQRRAYLVTVKRGNLHLQQDQIGQ